MIPWLSTSGESFLESPMQHDRVTGAGACGNAHRPVRREKGATQPGGSSFCVMVMRQIWHSQNIHQCFGRRPGKLLYTGALAAGLVALPYRAQAFPGVLTCISPHVAYPSISLSIFQFVLYDVPVRLCMVSNRWLQIWLCFLSVCPMPVAFFILIYPRSRTSSFSIFPGS